MGIRSSFFVCLLCIGMGACEPSSDTPERQVWMPDTNAVESIELAGSEPDFDEQCGRRVLAWQYVRDDQGRIVQATHRRLAEMAPMVDESYTYDLDGRLARTTSQVDGQSASTEWTYSVDGRLIRRATRSSDGQIVAYEEEKTGDEGERIIVSSYTRYFFGRHTYGLSRLEGDVGREVFSANDVIMDFSRLPPDVLALAIRDRFAAITQVTWLDDSERPNTIDWFIEGQQEPVLRRVITFDDDGDVTRETFDDDGLKGRFRTVTERNSDGFIVLQRTDEVVMNDDGSEGTLLVREMSMEYDVQGRMAYRLSRSESGRSQLRIRRSAHQVHEAIDADGDGVYEQVSTVYLNASGHRVLRQNDYDGDGTVDWQRRYAYNREGLRVFAERDQNVDGVPDRRTEYVYDESGRVVWTFELSPGRSRCTR